MNQKTTPRNRDEEEILGYRDVLNTIHESYEYIPISSNYILQLHKELFKYSEKGIGGRYKNTQNSIVEGYFMLHTNCILNRVAIYDTLMYTMHKGR